MTASISHNKGAPSTAHVAQRLLAPVKQECSGSALLSPLAPSQQLLTRVVTGVGLEVYPPSYRDDADIP